MSKEAIEQEFQMLESFYSPEQLHKEVQPQDGRITGGTFRAQARIPDTGAWVLSAESGGGGLKRHELKFVPRVVLNFQLPDGYPDTKEPVFSLSCGWLLASQLVAIGNQLRQLVAERPGEPVLWFWFEFLEQELWQFLSLGSELQFASAKWSNPNTEADDAQQDAGFSVVQLNRTVSQVEQEVMAVDAHERLQEFRRSFHECAVCASSKPGHACVRFRHCGHVFCEACVASAFRSLLQSGRPDKLGCLQCSGDDLPAVDPALVGRLLTPAEFANYEQRLLELSLSSMADVQRCPRCEVRVVTEDRRRHRLGQCPHCYYAFCLACREAYHGESCSGPRALTAATAGAETGAAGGAAAPGDRGRSEFSSLLGSLTGPYQLTDVALETIDFKSPHRNCPSCWTYIEKTIGCNHMQCWECKTHFCWVCQSVISSTDPYGHFRGGKCSGLLFQPVDLDAEDES